MIVCLIEIILKSCSPLNTRVSLQLFVFIKWLVKYQNFTIHYTNTSSPTHSIYYWETGPILSSRSHYYKWKRSCTKVWTGWFSPMLKQGFQGLQHLHHKEYFNMTKISHINIQVKKTKVVPYLILVCRPISQYST